MIRLGQPVRCAATSSFNKADSHTKVIFSRTASTRREPLNPVNSIHARQLVKTKRFLQARHGEVDELKEIGKRCVSASKDI
ncbi:hypothetical protein Ahy_B07g088452 isoform C [Arachis hypogaea]|uniref:Uncharacterized protein n=1 Tax=Arachis hypogaea TaxID=3818 RepID=A0A444YEH6_ARAHY|nr:hypothetical protein Ahy_B07g088452 isoform C [Arachis hypogaea]